MRIKSHFLFTSLNIFIVLNGMQSCSKELEIALPENVKLALRDVGHHLLLINQDSTSIVKPIIALDDYKYQLAFENQLDIHPDSLVAIIKNSLNKVQSPQHYLVEVLQCKSKLVAYSYRMDKNVEKSVIPCGGRQLQKGCYLITIHFTEVKKQSSDNIFYISLLLLVGLGLVIIVFYKRKTTTNIDTQDHPYRMIGRFKFYPQQNKLLKEATIIALSKKECELLTIFTANLNQIVTREELTKQVWEDNGVIVGRSLDTYISKLRKKLQDDNSIKLTNVHGVGYKLEVDNY